MMINVFTDFFSFDEPSIRIVVLGAILLALSSSLVGCFTLLRKRALAGDAVAHAVLPGVCLAFMIEGTKNPMTLLIGAFATGWLSLVAIDFITSRTRIKEDTAIGLVLSVFFGFGSLLLSYINHNPEAYPEQSGLNNFLFGSAVQLQTTDLYVFGAVAIAMIIVINLFYKEFKILSFDEEYAKSIGYPVRLIQLTLTTIIVFAVVIGIQTVGVILMAAMLITPAAAARFWTDNLRKMLILSALLGAFSGLAGTFISYAIDVLSAKNITSTNSPTGPWIVTVISSIALISILFAPKKGIIAKGYRHFKFKRKILEENILKALYQLGEADKDFYEEQSIDNVIQRRPMLKTQLILGLKRLKRHGFIENTSQSTFKLTKAGKEKGQRTTKLHRLWELYLTKYLNIAPDHVHEDADSIEHILTPQLEKELEKLLDFPTLDPHQTEIPYKS